MLRGVIAEMQQASKADIVSIFLYDEAARRYFAPFATGQPQESLLDSLADMSEQLARYTADAGAGQGPGRPGHPQLRLDGVAHCHAAEAGCARRPF